MRQEASVYLLVHNSTILLGRELGMSISDLRVIQWPQGDERPASICYFTIPLSCWVTG
ncbi:hypothetical protein L208DRAFT_723653 [Tricholoma matsutake]|nr:hypothetical protein L208DRAFT_723653 [Tricholoma matsutake 945]